MINITTMSFVLFALAIIALLYEGLPKNTFILAGLYSISIGGLAMDISIYKAAWAIVLGAILLLCGLFQHGLIAGKVK